jgi:predicted DNA-binding ribbon-helix-helix protein
MMKPRHPVDAQVGSRAVKRTSIRLEPEMWRVLSALAAERGATLSALITEIDRTRNASSLSSAVRVYLLEANRAF